MLRQVFANIHALILIEFLLLTDDADLSTFDDADVELSVQEKQLGCKKVAGRTTGEFVPNIF